MSDPNRETQAISPPDLTAASPYDSAAVDRARNALDAIPDHISRYRILERIGSGGMGEVFVAEQTAPIKRRVALKIIKAGMDTRQVIARFEAERQALAMMDHPNIAKVFDAGTTDAGRPYFVMELVRGVPITQFCDDARFTTRQRVELLVPVCQAVQHAHQKGVIHRDLKPSNVLVTLHDGVPVPKVIDFGIAKTTSQPLTDKTVYTEFRQMIGTPAYMSPEQAEMSGLDIDTRSDIYSLGVLMYELLTGTTPFETARLVKAGLMEIQRIIREEEPPRPSLRISSLGITLPSVAAQRGIEPARLGKVLAGELDWIVMRAMEKDRKRRYETASDLAADLNRHLGGEPVIAAPPSAAYRTSKFVRKHRGPVIVTTTVSALLILGLAGTTWQWRQARRNAAIATANESRAERERVTAEQQKDAAETEAYIANVALGQSAMQADLWPEARRRLDACPPSNRGWEWRYLRAVADNVDHAFEDYGGVAAVSPDGRMVCSVRSNRLAQLLDLRTGEALYSRWFALPRNADGPEHTDRLIPPAFSPDSKRLLLAADTSVRVFSATGDLTAALIRFNKFVDQAAFAPDGGSIVVRLEDGTAERRALDGVAMGPARADDPAFAGTTSQLSLVPIEENTAVELRDESGRAVGVARDFTTSGLTEAVFIPGTAQITAIAGKWDWEKYAITPSRRLVIDLQHFDAPWFEVEEDGETELEAELLEPLPPTRPASAPPEAKVAVLTTDGSRIISSNSDIFVRFIDASTGRELAAVSASERVTQLRLSRAARG